MALAVRSVRPFIPFVASSLAPYANSRKDRFHKSPPAGFVWARLAQAAAPLLVAARRGASVPPEHYTSRARRGGGALVYAVPLVSLPPALDASRRCGGCPSVRPPLRVVVARWRCHLFHGTRGRWWRPWVRPWRGGVITTPARARGAVSVLAWLSMNYQRRRRAAFGVPWWN